MGCRVRPSSKSSEHNSSQKHLPAAPALAAIPLCALQVRCLKSAIHQPEIAEERRKAQHLDALNAQEKTKNISVQTLKAAAEQEGETQEEKQNNRRKYACGLGTWRPLVDFDPKHVSVLPVS